jgi:predicted site-specific integrase-resolvase
MTHTARLADYLTVKDAAAYLGVSPSTLRNWDRAGKLYRLTDLEAVLRAVHRRAHG